MQIVFVVCGLEAIAVQEKRFPCWHVLSNMVITQYRSTSGTKAKLPWMANATLLYATMCGVYRCNICVNEGEFTEDFSFTVTGILQ